MRTRRSVCYMTSLRDPSNKIQTQSFSDEHKSTAIKRRECRMVRIFTERVKSTCMTIGKKKYKSYTNINNAFWKRSTSVGNKVWNLYNFLCFGSGSFLPTAKMAAPISVRVLENHKFWFRFRLWLRLRRLLAVLMFS